MKYTLEGFSQEAALSFKKEIEVKDPKTKKLKKKTIGLDLIDLTILRWFVDFYPHMKKYNDDEVQYAWVNYESVLTDLPLLGIEKKALYNRFNKMVELGILIHKHVKDGGSFSYYSFGGEYIKLIDTPPRYSNTNPSESEFLPPRNSNDPPLGIQIPNKDSSINNPSINYNKKEEPKPKIKNTYEQIIDTYTDDPKLKETILEFIKMRKLKKKPPTDNALALILKKLDKLSNTTSGKIEILEQSIIRCYEDVFEIKQNFQQSTDKPKGFIPPNQYSCQSTDPKDWL